jgi:hypothetical protein
MHAAIPAAPAHLLTAFPGTGCVIWRGLPARHSTETIVGVI